MTANPHYAADWQRRLASAEAAHDYAQAKCTMLPLGSPAHRAAQEQLAQAREALRLARLARFPLIADYAASLFTGLAADQDGFLVLPDFTEFTSIEQADAAHERALRRQREAMLERQSRLQTGQPPGLHAFAATGEVVSTWRHFGSVDSAIVCHVSFHETGELYHVCLSHHWGRLHRHSNEAFSRIATLLAREAMQILAPETAPVFRAGGHLEARNRTLIRTANALAARFRFYRHLLPENGMREEFARVDMVWDGVCFVDPDWTGTIYQTLPEALHLASFIPPEDVPPAPPRLGES